MAAYLRLRALRAFVPAVAEHFPAVVDKRRDVQEQWSG